MVCPGSGSWRNQRSVDSLGVSSVSEDCFSRKVAKLAGESGFKSLLVSFYLPNVRGQLSPEAEGGRGLAGLVC